MNRLGKTFTFSNVTAFIALFVALGGSVYAAGKISGTQIATNSIPGNRIKTKTLTGKQVKPNALTGKQINESSLSGVSAGSLAGVQYATAVIPLAPLTNFNETSVTVIHPTAGTASCPAGTSVIGGGATVSDEIDAAVNDSAPSTTRNGWTATGISYEFKAISMTVTAICTPVASASG
jgi:hypothetical protein